MAIIRRLIRTQGRTGPFWRLSIGEGPGSLTFFGRSARQCVDRYQAHCRAARRAELRRGDAA